MSSIYHDEHISKTYDQTRTFQEENIELVFREVLRRLFEPAEKEMRCFEGGIGTGIFTILLAKELTRRFEKASIWGIDNSISMLQEFERKIGNKQPLSTVPLVFGFGDLEYRLPFPDNFFQLNLLAGVVHCLNNWQAAMLNMNRILQNGGYIIIVIRDKCPWDGPMEQGKAEIVAFWNRYYELRNQLSIPLDPKVRYAYEIAEVGNFLVKNGYRFQDVYDTIGWIHRYSFDNFLRLIGHGTMSALGSGISREQRSTLAQEIRSWTMKEKIALRSSFDFTAKIYFNVWQKC